MSLPVAVSRAYDLAAWFKKNFEAKINDALIATPYSVDLLCGIFLQEVGNRVSLWIDDYPVNIVLERCVFDATGDYPGTEHKRSAFPVNRAEFEAAYGYDFTQMLIDEANKMRAMPQPGYPGGYSARDWLYKAYGLFAYDLQNIQDRDGFTKDKIFFEAKQWYSFDHCLERCIKILNEKKVTDLWQTVKRYNGSGEKAEMYANNVMEFTEISKTV